ncbi:MAG: winged helix-turn-helix transcriptional regulator [Spirochaetaceae bacterium]|nr:winged helix-turn-helix transcriptional regulator [Spirochaetaceae bacterium]
MDDINKLQLIFQTLSDQNRLKIIREIDRSEKSVSEITDALQLSQPLISHHLKSLKKTGVLITRRNGPFIFYRLKEPLLLDLLGSFLNIFQEMDMDSIKEEPGFATPAWWIQMRKNCMGGKRWE